MIEETDYFLGIYSCSAFTLNLLERTDFLRGAHGRYLQCTCTEVSVEIVGRGKHSDVHYSKTKQVTNCMKVFMFLMF